MCSVRNQPISTSGLGPNCSRRKASGSARRRNAARYCSARRAAARSARAAPRAIAWKMCVGRNTSDPPRFGAAASRPRTARSSARADRRVLEAVGQHVRLGRTVRVADLDQRQRRVVRPARAVDDARGGDGSALAAEPARLRSSSTTVSAVSARTSMRRMCAGWTVGSSRTQFQLPRHVKRSSVSRSCITYG